MGTWFNVLIVVLFAVLVGVFFFGYFSVRGPAPPQGVYSVQMTISDEEHGTFTAVVAPPGGDLPYIELRVDETEATVSFAELRTALKLTGEEDQALKELIDTWDTLTEDEKSDALNRAIDMLRQIITDHPAELKALILKKAGEDEPKPEIRNPKPDPNSKSE